MKNMLGYLVLINDRVLVVDIFLQGCSGLFLVVSFIIILSLFIV